MTIAGEEMASAQDLADATRVRRLALVTYATALSIGTHWPRLQLGDPMHPPDKMLHFVAFGGLAFFLGQSRYLATFVGLAAVGIVWTAADEASQLFPGLGRTFSWEDLVASASGFLVVTALLWAMRPRGERGAALRRARFDAAIDNLLSRPVGWMALLSAGALGAATGVPLAQIVNAHSDSPTPFQAGVTGAVLGSGTAVGILLVSGIRHEERKAIAEGRWRELPSPGWRDVLRASLLPASAGVAALVAAFGAWAVMQGLSREVAFVHEARRWLDSLSKGMETVIDATFVGFLAALVIEFSRRRLARRVDDGDRVCLACAHDLRATGAPDGWGRCPECGAHFWRPL